MAQRVKRLPAMQGTQVLSLGWEDPLEKEMATHSSILAWEIPWTEEPGGLQSMGSQELGTTQQLSHYQTPWAGPQCHHLGASKIENLRPHLRPMGQNLHSYKVPQTVHVHITV